MYICLYTVEVGYLYKLPSITPLSISCPLYKSTQTYYVIAFRDLELLLFDELELNPLYLYVYRDTVLLYVIVAATLLTEVGHETHCYRIYFPSNTQI